MMLDWQGGCRMHWRQHLLVTIGKIHSPIRLFPGRHQPRATAIDLAGPRHRGDTNAPINAGRNLSAEFCRSDFLTISDEVLAVSGDGLKSRG